MKTKWNKNNTKMIKDNQKEDTRSKKWMKDNTKIKIKWKECIWMDKIMKNKTIMKVNNMKMIKN